MLVYAFILEYGLRLATVFAMTRALAAREDSLLLRLAPLISRLPPASAESQPIRYEGSQQAAGPGAYFFTVIFLAFLAVVLGNVNADRELDLDAIRFEQDLQWASGLAIIYWVQSLLTRTTVIDPKARWDVNVGYNTRELTVLAVAVLVAGMVVVVRQANDLPASGWRYSARCSASGFSSTCGAHCRQSRHLVIVRVHLAGANRDRQHVCLRRNRTVVVIRERARRVVGEVEVEQVIAVRQLLHVDVAAQLVALFAAGRVAEEHADVVLADARLEQADRLEPDRRRAHHEVEPADALRVALCCRASTG